MLDLPVQRVTMYDGFVVSKGGPGHGVSVAGLAWEVSLLEDGFRTGFERGELARAEIRLKVSEQARA